MFLEIPYQSPVDLFATFSGQAYSSLIDNDRFSYIAADPFQKVCARDGQDPFATLEAALEPWFFGTELDVPFQTGAVGYLSYEAGRFLEKMPALHQKGISYPDMIVALYDTIIAFDHHTRKAWIISNGFPEKTAKARAQKAKARLEYFSHQITKPRPEKPSCFTLKWTAETSKETYIKNVQKTLSYIREGDIYQANISRKFFADRPKNCDPYRLYENLKSRMNAPFSACLVFEDGRAIVSASPERFLKLEAGGRVTTSPIKGTRPRGKDKQEDQELALALQKSTKDRAENLMIVDLLRNDLSRVCDQVTTESLCKLESFSNVHHLASTITGHLKDGKRAIDLLRATFPGGSITGAPKIRAMEIIHELEPSRRGPYCGTIAWFGFNGAMDSNIVIRTMVLTKDQLIVQAGSGIVSDSDPETEYQELQDKIWPLL